MKARQFWSTGTENVEEVAPYSTIAIDSNGILRQLITMFNRILNPIRRKSANTHLTK